MSAPRRPRIALCLFVSFSFLCASCGKPPVESDKPPTPEETLTKAARFLVSQQTEDGGWHSDTYGNLKGGVATTALVCYALAHLPEEIRKEHDPAIRRGLEQLVSQISKAEREGGTVGFVGDQHGGANYPTYVTGMTLATYYRLGWELPAADEEAMIEYLESAQLGRSRGWEVDDPEFGGWDLMGDQLIEGRTPGSNVSVTSFALEAFSEVRGKVDVPTLVFAENWLDQLQRMSTGGGFAFGPKQHANKAGFKEEGDKVMLYSYGSATCDGLRSLAYLGVEEENDRVTKAIAWLAGNDTLEKVPGFDDAPDKQWPESLYYYYTMTLAKTYGLYPKFGSVTRRGGLASQVIKRQKENGSWVNAAAGMREDDPLVATSFALVALAEASK